MATHHREEVLNVILAQIIVARGLNASPESIIKSGKDKDMPDVFIIFRGLRCVIEGKYADVAGSKIKVLDQALERVEEGIAQLATAIVYSAELRSVPFDELYARLAVEPLQSCVCTEVGASDWKTGGVDEILEELRRAQEVLVRDDTVQEVAEQLSGHLEMVSNIFTGEPVICDKLIALLGIGEAEKKSTEDDD